MTNIVLIIQLFLLLISSAGLFSLWLIHRRSPSKISRLLCLIFLLLELNQLRFIVVTLLPADLLATRSVMTLQAGIAIGVIFAVYIILASLLDLLESGTVLRNGILAAVAVLVQSVRVLVAFTPVEIDPLYSYVLSLFLISAYIFWAGYVFRRKVDAAVSSGLRILLQRLGSLTMFFAPVSFAVYSLGYLLQLNFSLSLDSVLLVLWSSVTIQLLLEYLNRVGSIPGFIGERADAAQSYGLSPRESEVLPLVLKGLNNREIGETLYISYTTARTHVSHIFEKVGVKSRVELISRLLND
ncbi:helix-turn-helix transcriptional regulator [Salinispira pacifica]|uniref:HTH luxR-type domain-containing protein n=1 Tax=Salinispira pacifica TaxID=1307761 RepID=V5WNB3_9SPIO|nr:helix-turn-helix transcriptional regulator [Salinispira pacifica]AHC16719.1 hypothetical protein L21SP2_3381 [Salinispira pacifica]